MTAPDEPSRPTDQRKRELCVMISVGCDRETACKFHGWSAPELRRELESDPEFANKVLRAEGTAEFTHMRAVHEAAKDVKNWRVSVWWLERRAPERFARRPPHALSATQLGKIIKQIVDMIVEQVTDQDDRRRLLMRLEKIADEVADKSFDAPQVASALRLEQAAEDDSAQEHRE